MIRGGRSLEREISLRSGHHVASALRHLGHDATEVDVDDTLSSALENVDVAFITLHGRDGEDGTIQLLCEAIGVAYTGSAPLTCRLCFDKGLAKGILEEAGLATPEAFVLTSEAIRHMGAGAALRRAAARLGFPLIVKPSAQGSALGSTVVEDPAGLTSATMAAFDYGERMLVERFVPGAEVAITLAGADLTPLPAVEIRTRSGAFDFETRVSPGAFELVSPTDVADDRAADLAKRAARTLGVRDFARVDLRIGDDGPTVLDLKTCPGLTESSIVPMAVASSGARFEDFVSNIIDAALARSSRAKI